MASVLFLDPYHGPSHSALSTALRDHSRHDVTLLTMEARKWKWRMRGAALAFEPRIRALPAPPDILVVTDMVNLPELLSLLRDHFPPRIPVVAYFHENQLTYPLPVRDERDFHFGLMNIYTALAADRVIFNSEFHRDEFLGALPSVLAKMPDHRPQGIEERILARSAVLGPPIDVAPSGAPRENLILWNHRWEDDKDPESFFRVMRRLDDRGTDFGLVMLGQSFQQRPACFDRARKDLAHRIRHWGYVESREEYVDLMSRCRVAVSTARHEFYGLAVREAVACGCYPLLPRRVVYPELVHGREEFLYGSEQELLESLVRLMEDPGAVPVEEMVAEIAAQGVAPIVGRWDEWLDSLS